MLDVGTEAADAGQDRFLCLGMSGDSRGSESKPIACVKGEFDGDRCFGQREPLRLLALALLHIGAKPAVAQGDLIACRRVLAQNPDARSLAIGGAIRACVRQGAGEFAFGIIRAADKGAEFAKFQRQLAIAAGRARARIRAVFLGGKICGARSSFRLSRTWVVRRSLVPASGAGKIRPEIAQHLLPVELVVGDMVEFLLKLGGEIIADIAGEEAFQKGRDETALVFGMKPLLVERAHSRGRAAPRGSRHRSRAGRCRAPPCA